MEGSLGKGLERAKDKIEKFPIKHGQRRNAAGGPRNDVGLIDVDLAVRLVVWCRLTL